MLNGSTAIKVKTPNSQNEPASPMPFWISTKVSVMINAKPQLVKLAIELPGPLTLAGRI